MNEGRPRYEFRDPENPNITIVREQCTGEEEEIILDGLGRIFAYLFECRERERPSGHRARERERGDCIAVSHANRLVVP